MRNNILTWSSGQWTRSWICISAFREVM